MEGKRVLERGRTVKKEGFLQRQEGYLFSGMKFIATTSILAWGTRGDPHEGPPKSRTSWLQWDLSFKGYQLEVYPQVLRKMKEK